MMHNAMTLRVRWYGCLLLVALLVTVVGCGKKGSATKSSRSKTEALYRVKAKEKTSVAIEHGGKRSESKLPPDGVLFDGDTVENTGKKPATLHETTKDHRFNLAPAARVQVGDGTITLFQGGARFEFKKVDGEFRIVLPRKAALAIRGTEFIVVASLDGTTTVRMLSGKLDIETAGKVTSLAAPATACLGHETEPVQIYAEPAQIPPAVLQSADAVAIGLGDNIERFERNRKSNY